MVKVIRYIRSIHDKDDFRVQNNKVFHLQKIYNSNIESYIKYYNFDEDIQEESEDDDKGEREYDDEDKSCC